MTRIFIIIGLGLSLFFTPSCKKIEGEKLVGAWQGMTMEVNEVTKVADASDFQLVMRQDETYTLTSLEGVTENGTYHTRMGTLYLRSENGERPYIVSRLDTDTMFLKVDAGNVAILKLRRRL